MMKLLPAIIFSAWCLSLSRAWSSPTTNNNHQQNSGLSRRSCLEGLAAGVMGVALLPKPAFADVTNRVASPAALRSVKRAQKQLQNLLPPAQANDYMQIKTFLRKAPFADVRQKSFVLLRGGEDGPNAQTLESTYKAFIASVEQIDNTAGLGMRGRKIPELRLTEEFYVVESTMEAFLKVAIEDNEIPVQDSSE
jgi:hypothetical protein